MVKSKRYRCVGSCSVKRRKVFGKSRLVLVDSKGKMVKRRGSKARCQRRSAKGKFKKGSRSRVTRRSKPCKKP